MGRPKAATLNRGCEVCSEKFTTPDTKRGRKRVTCSKTCASKLAYINQETHAPCVHCGKPTKTAKSVVNGGLPVYCDDCSTQRYKHECDYCGTEFRAAKYDTRFCSRECNVEANRANLVEVECYCCGAMFERPSFSVYDGKRSFCSLRCRNRQTSRDYPTRYGSTWTTWLRRIHARDTHCLKCGATENLQVHHFKKLRTFPDPNQAHYDDNLGLFCIGCHVDIELEGVGSLEEFYSRYSPTPRESAGG